jgi:hypothetical protein
MILNIWLVFRRRTDSEMNCNKAKLFVKTASGHVFLMRVKFEATWRKRHRMFEQCLTNPHALTVG